MSGTKIIRMESLRKSLNSLGFQKVETYIQSGNVVFQAKETDSTQLVKNLKSLILREFGFDVPILVKTAQELSQTMKKNPFIHQRSCDVSKLHVTFLSNLPKKKDLQKLETLSQKTDRYQIIGKEIYLYCPNGYGNTQFSNNVIEKALQVEATTRNWKTILRVCEMANESESSESS